MSSSQSFVAKMIRNDSLEIPGVVYGVGFTFMASSIICSFYIFWHDGRRFPFYIAISDVFLSLSLLLNQLKPATTGSLWDGSMCKFAATLVGVFVMANMTLVASVMFATYMAVCRDSPLNFGTGDWKLFLVVIGFSSIIAAIGIPGAGQSRYWCYGENYSPDNSLQIVTLSVELGMFFATFLFAVEVVRFLITSKENKKILRKKFADGNTPTQAGASVAASSVPVKGVEIQKKELMEDRATRKILSFVLNYFIQWTSVVPYVFGSVFFYYESWVYVVCTIGMNCGGILNLIAFVTNEGWSDEPVSSSATSKGMTSAKASQV